jgi:hypothetical protein
MKFASQVYILGLFSCVHSLVLVFLTASYANLYVDTVHCTLYEIWDKWLQPYRAAFSVLFYFLALEMDIIMTYFTASLLFSTILGHVFIIIHNTYETLLC